MAIDTTFLKQACKEELATAKNALQKAEFAFAENKKSQEIYTELYATFTASRDRINMLLSTLPPEVSDRMEDYMNGPAKDLVQSREEILQSLVTELGHTDKSPEKIAKILNPLVSLRRRIAKLLLALGNDDLWREDSDTSIAFGNHTSSTNLLLDDE